MTIIMRTFFHFLYSLIRALEKKKAIRKRKLVVNLGMNDKRDVIQYDINKEK